jgi:CheY-like chemotaxis protein
MNAAGCEVKRGKHIAFRAKEQKRFIRCSSLGSGYSEQEINDKLANKNISAPDAGKNDRRNAKEKPPVNMLLDIQAAIQAGKGPGYECFAKLFNLKESAKTLIYLQEAGLTDYSSLEKKSAEAVKLFSEAPESYDMIFMDVQMPEMDGYEATRLIRASGCANSATVPIVAMTANVFREDVEKCLASGMNDHVGKPLDFEEVLTKLRKYLPKGKLMGS